MYRFKLIALRLSAIVFLVFSITGASAAQEKPLHIKYWLAMSQPGSHLFEVTIEVELPSDPNLRSLDFQMPRWSPGRYAVFDFAKNVQEFQAVGSICPPKTICDQPLLSITRVDDQTWRVPVTSSTGVTINYKVFANDLSGTFSQLDSRHANVNGGCVFMYIVNHKRDPVRLSINAPTSWRIVNGRSEKKDQSEFQFPNWDVMIDTSTEIAPD